MISRSYGGVQLFYQLEDGVIGLDYYKDCLVQQLPRVVKKLYQLQKRPLTVLDMATGHGYTAIILAKCYPGIVGKIVVYDINPKAVALARENAKLNNCEEKIDFREGSIYGPLKKNEKFDLIISALPPIPISTEELQGLPKDVQLHHWPTSTGGVSGRDLIDAMIKDAPEHLRLGGAILTVHADFLSCESTLKKITSVGLEGMILGPLVPKKLRDTKLTTTRRLAIKKLGYKFTLDSDRDEQFFIAVFFGQKLGKI